MIKSIFFILLCSCTHAYQPNVAISRDYNGLTTINTIVAKSAGYTATAKDETIEVTSSATISLPAASGLKGKIYYIYSTGTAIATIDPNSTETVCGQTTIKTIGANDGVEIQSDGSNWKGLNGSCELSVRMEFGGGASGGFATSACSGTCVIANQNGAWASTPVRSGSGRYGITITGFSAGPVCTCNIGRFGVSTGGFGDCEATSSTNIEVVARNTSGTLTDNVVGVICLGPR